MDGHDSAEPAVGGRLRHAITRSGSLAYERVVFFSDAVFAIAITLLIVDLRVPDLPSDKIHPAQVLDDATPKLIGFGVSFAVVGLFWLGHHVMFTHITALNRTLILLNLLFLGCIAFLPFPTALLSAAPDDRTSTIFYAVCITVAGLSQAAIWWYAVWGSHLVGPDTSASTRWYYLLRYIRTPVAFIVSIPVAFLDVRTAQFTWCLVVVFGLVLRRLPLGTRSAETFGH